MKKLLAIVLFLTMMVALAVPVMAVDFKITANKATIVIDGIKDDAYADNFLAINGVKDGSEDTTTTGKIWAAWDDNYIYFYAEIYDKTPNSSADTGEAHFRDSTEVYLDWNNGQGGDREGSPEFPYYQVRIQASPGDGVAGPVTGFILDDEDWAGFADWTLRGEEENVKYFAGPYDGNYKNGYIIEFAVPVPKDYPVTLTEGKQIPFDTQINDNLDGVGRGAEIYIDAKNENNGNQWQAPSSVGALLILGGAYVPPAAPADPEPEQPPVDDNAQGGGDVPPPEVIAPPPPAPKPTAPKVGDTGMIMLIAVMAAAGVVVLRKKAVK